MSAAFDWAKKPLSPELLEGLETETGKHMKGGRMTVYLCAQADGWTYCDTKPNGETFATVDISEEEATSVLSRDSAAYAEAERQGYVIYNRGKDLYERA